MGDRDIPGSSEGKSRSARRGRRRGRSQGAHLSSPLQYDLNRVPYPISWRLYHLAIWSPLDHVGAVFFSSKSENGGKAFRARRSPQATPLLLLLLLCPLPSWGPMALLRALWVLALCGLATGSLRPHPTHPISLRQLSMSQVHGTVPPRLRLRGGELDGGRAGGRSIDVGDLSEKDQRLWMAVYEDNPNELLAGEESPSTNLPGSWSC